jgi:uncharacterized protein (DUF4415 family)
VKKIVEDIRGRASNIASADTAGDPMPEGDNPDWTEEDFARARPASEVHGGALAAQLVRGRGRPAKAEGERKEAVSIRLSPEVLSHFRATGPGWQSRIEEVLLKHVRAAPLEEGVSGVWRGRLDDGSVVEVHGTQAEAVSAGRAAAYKGSTHRVGRNAATGQYVAVRKGAGVAKNKDRA